MYHIPWRLSPCLSEDLVCLILRSLSNGQLDWYFHGLKLWVGGICKRSLNTPKHKCWFRKYYCRTYLSYFIFYIVLEVFEKITSSLIVIQYHLEGFIVWGKFGDVAFSVGKFAGYKTHVRRFEIHLQTQLSFPMPRLAFFPESRLEVMVAPRSWFPVIFENGFWIKGRVCINGDADSLSNKGDRTPGLPASLSDLAFSNFEIWQLGFYQSKTFSYLIYSLVKVSESFWLLPDVLCVLQSN